VRPSATSRCATSRRVAVALGLALALSGEGGARAAAPGGLGHIVGLRTRADSSATVIEVLADRPLSFTTLRLTAPSRVVLDFADAELSAVPAELVVEDGIVRRIGAAAAGARTARVVIELAAEAEFDVHAVGPRLDVRIARPRPAVASRASPAAEPSPAPSPAADQAGPSPAPVARTEAVSPPLILVPADEPDPGAPAPEGPTAGPVKQPPAPAAAPAPAADPGPVGREAPPAAAVARVEAPPAPAVARVEAPPAAAVARVEAPPAAAAVRVDAAPLPVPERVQALPGPDVARAGSSPRASQLRLPAADEPLGAATREREKRASLPTVSIGGNGSPATDAATASEGPPATAPTDSRVAAAPPGPSSNGVASAAPPKDAPRRAGKVGAIRGIGFRAEGQGVVLVRSDGPVEYSVTRGDRQVLLHFDSATISVANNRRPLDTRFFGGPVERIVPVASAASTEVRIELREAADFQVQQTAGLLTVTFTR
jgi:AMIN domain